MAFQMALVEFLMYSYYMESLNIYLLLILMLGTIYTGYKLTTLNFLDDRQFLLAMIEHHENAIVMANAHNKYYPSHNQSLNKLTSDIRSTQQNEIQLMYDILGEKPH
jgi:hypothetical protein